MRKLLLVAALCALSFTAHAQYGIGASLTAQRISNLNSGTVPNSWVYGPTLSMQREYGKVFKFGFDVRASFLNGSGISVNSLTVGPRLGFNAPKAHIKIYGEVLLGIMGVRPEPGRNRTGHLDVAFAAGVDHALTHHLDWRVLEYECSRVPDTNGFSGEDTRNQLSTGIVYRF